MKRLLGAVTLSLAVAGGGIVANASVPLPLVEQWNGAPTLSRLLKQITPAVVSIATKSRTAPETNSSSSKGQRSQRTANRRTIEPDRHPQAVGSGVVIDADQGLILTNNHVIDRADEIVVTLSNGRELQANRVGSDPDTDVALIKVTAGNLTAIPVGNSDPLEAGDFVLAIGNPFQIGQTVTSGIISGLHRNNVGIEQHEDFIQTDAAIYPGNSGGALVNLRGELIGINTAFKAVGQSNAGIGFAIPINMVRSIADQILEFGEVRRGRLGITYEDPPRIASRSMKHAVPHAGPKIVTVEAGSAAARAGLKAGDMVTEFASAAIRDTFDLRNRMGLLSVGDIAELTVMRDGKPVAIRATIADEVRRVSSK